MLGVWLHEPRAIHLQQLDIITNLGQFDSRMITMYGEQRQRELRQPAFRIHIPPAAIVIDSSITEYNENILSGRIHVFTEAFNSAEFPMGIPCDISILFPF